MWDKQGAIVDFPITYIASFISLIIILVFFSFYFLTPSICFSESNCISPSGINTQAIFSAEQAMSSSSLFSFLNLESSQGDIADLIIESHYDPSKQQELNETLTPLLNQLEVPKLGAAKSWSLTITRYPKKQVLQTIARDSSLVISEKSFAKPTLHLPLKDPQEGYLEVTLELDIAKGVDPQ